jgi:hypothetical protein
MQVSPRVVRAVLVLLASGVGPAAAQTAGPATAGPVVVTTGTAVVRAAPDLAFAGLSATGRAKAPAQAQRQSADAMSAVRKALAAAGVADTDVRTVRYDLQPEYDYADGRQTLRGYAATNAIEVRVRALDRLGDLVDRAVGAGATEVTGIRFDIADRSVLERQALAEAVADARAKAEAAAKGAGLTVTAIVRIEEGTGRGEPGPVALAMRVQAAAEATPMAPGELEIRATVTLTAGLSR